MRRMYLAPLLFLSLPAPSWAQTVACYTPEQCRQVRVANEQAVAAQEFAAARQRQAEIKAQRDAYRAVAAERALAQRAADVREQQLVVARVKYEQDTIAAQARARTDIENRASAQMAAEQSPSNICVTHDIATSLLDWFNRFEGAQNSRVQAIDIEHLTTLTYNPSDKTYTCHGDFILTDGIRSSGILSTRKNVAGQTIGGFRAD